MNKGQGLFAGAILALAILFRPFAVNPPSTSDSAKLTQGQPGSLAGRVNQNNSDQPGPWLASCRYWSEIRIPSDGASNKSTDTSSYSPRQDLSKALIVNNNYNYAYPQEPKEESNCGLDEKRWGFPDSNDIANGITVPDITAVVAIVPDPVHTHLSLAFDRAIQVLLQAASDAGYVSSYYWLPWRSNPGITNYQESALNKEAGHNPDRERQPGLIVLKHISTDSTWGPHRNFEPKETYFRALYLFLVAESPTEGIDGQQFRRALEYESEIKGIVGDQHFESGPPNRTAIIGPIYTGSASSLRAGVDAFCGAAIEFCKPEQFEIVGATETVLSVKQLIDQDPCAKPKSPGWIEYLSFGPHVSYTTQEFFRLATLSGVEPDKIAVLSEDNTAYGNKGINGPNKTSDNPPLDEHTCTPNEPQPQIPPPPPIDSVDPHERILYMFFPREISLLRNTPVDTDSSSSGTSSGTVPSPYLHFSVKDSNGRDSVIQFSREHSPLSQEAQLMEIAREMNHRRIELIAIAASNPLDVIFLAQFFHLACPDARLVFVENDLLMVRDVDNLPYIGSLTLNPYSFLTKLQRLPGDTNRTYTDTMSEAFYNAAAYVFLNIRPSDPDSNFPNPYTNPSNPSATPPPTAAPFQGYRYRNRLTQDHPGLLQPPPLWAMTLGSDGYYPLGIVSPCSRGADVRAYSDRQDTRMPDPAGNHLFPNIQVNERSMQAQYDALCNISDSDTSRNLHPSLLPKPFLATIHTSLTWFALCLGVSFFCLFHALLLRTADYNSPLTHDLAVRDNDQPQRRSVYIRMSTVFLSSMGFVLVIPWFVLAVYLNPNLFDAITAGFTVLSAGLATWAALWDTRGYIHWSKARATPILDNLVDRLRFVFKRIAANIYFFLNLLAHFLAIGIPLWWTWICTSNSYQVLLAPGVSKKTPLSFTDLFGLAFSYRCIHPESGVSPIVPVLLMLFGWYIWGILQTWRLRFAERGKPWLPYRTLVGEEGPLYVSEGDLDRFDRPGDPGLYVNIKCLFMVRNLIQRIFCTRAMKLDIILTIAFAAVFGLFTAFTPFRSIDHFFWSVRKFWSSPYEALIGALFILLFWFAFSAWLRLIFVWISLKKGLLEPLENLPIRFAFSRLQGKGWMTVLSRVGLQEQKRDLDRCIESMRQMFHLQDLKSKDISDLFVTSKQILDQRAQILASARSPGAARPKVAGHTLTREIQVKLAIFSQKLLDYILIPFWRDERTGLVESEDVESLPIKARRVDNESEQSQIPLELRVGPSSENPPQVLAAEEFIAMRYMTLIRAVLGNLSYLMTFFSLTFVLSVVAWNSYPFQPRQFVDLLFTAALALWGFGVIVVFAQMHRDPILSRVTATRPNELGWHFYLRTLSVGAIPVLTWLAYHFPDIGGAIYRFVQPNTSVFR